MDELDQTYRTYFPLLRAKCRRILGSNAEAEEVAQETFLRLWNRGPRNRDVPIITAWLYRVATRAAIDRLRRRTREGHSEPRYVLLGPGGGEARLQLAELARTTHPTQLAAVLLHRVDGLTQSEVAEVLAISDRHVRRLIATFDADQEATP